MHSRTSFWVSLYPLSSLQLFVKHGLKDLDVEDLSRMNWPKKLSPNLEQVFHVENGSKIYTKWRNASCYVSAY
jgi:hypothetical protein